MKQYLFLLSLLIFLNTVLSIEVKSNAIYELYKIDDYEIEFIYERPQMQINGVIFFAHGCHHRATDWWPKSTICPQCIGLPIEVSLISKAINNNFLAVAMSSMNRFHKCWTKTDVIPAFHMIDHLFNISKLSPSKVPLFLMGASSGGAFVEMFSRYLTSNNHKYKVSAMSVQISTIFDHRQSLLTMLSTTFISPPVAFIYMPKDSFTALKINKDYEVLQQHKIPALIYSITPKPLNVTYFTKYNVLKHDESKRLIEAFIRNGIISKSTSELVEDPRESEWRPTALQALPEVFPARDSLEADQSPISELMNVAWAYHEITDEYADEVFKWFRLQWKNSTRIL